MIRMRLNGIINCYILPERLLYACNRNVLLNIKNNDKVDLGTYVKQMDARDLFLCV